MATAEILRVMSSFPRPAAAPAAHERDPFARLEVPRAPRLDRAHSSDGVDRVEHVTIRNLSATRDDQGVTARRRNPLI
jgi:hypothetical protein